MARCGIARRLARSAERVAWTLGLFALSVWAVANVSGTVAARRELRDFHSQPPTLRAAVVHDTADWSEKRRREWRETLAREAPAALAILRVPRLKIEVAVLEGTDDWTLNRAVGHIEETAMPGAAGNVGIAGHRDGFFRALKDVAVGDIIELDTPTHRERHRVERVWIVAPEDVWVIDPTDVPSITLVTCYPFYFIGSAPQRYIVRAVRVETVAREPPPS